AMAAAVAADWSHPQQPDPVPNTSTRQSRRRTNMPSQIETPATSSIPSTTSFYSNSHDPSTAFNTIDATQSPFLIPDHHLAASRRASMDFASAASQYDPPATVALHSVSTPTTELEQILEQRRVQSQKQRRASGTTGGEGIGVLALAAEAEMQMLRERLERGEVFGESEEMGGGGGYEEDDDDEENEEDDDDSDDEYEGKSGAGVEYSDDLDSML
ncbi:hypothetical protein HDU99_000802, partial [Rhizoclosmatium hyalinum]